VGHDRGYPIVKNNFIPLILSPNPNPFSKLYLLFFSHSSDI
jgi:hypothetical protein